MDRNIFFIVLVVVLVLLYIHRKYETFVDGSYNITPNITTDMDWKGAMLSKFPYYTNNLINPPTDKLTQIKQLQKYQQKSDGPTDTTYVAKNMKVEHDLDNPNNREGFEGFSMMNPYVSNQST